jgi:methylthioribose-1-phosphate isomerase
MSSAQPLCSLRWNPCAAQVEVIDQTLLPHRLQWLALSSPEDFCTAISSMQVRGAPLIGIAAAFGLACALERDPSDEGLRSARAALLATRPTAVNLAWALQQVGAVVAPLPPAQRAQVALQRALALRAADIASCSRIGDHGLQLLRALQPEGRLNVMTHCNAGWLATVEWGTALAPVFKARQAGLPIHVWVSETRPRNQGASLTAWELQQADVPFTVVTDSSCGQLLRAGEVDCVLVGSDRTAANGDVCNKVGTYLKALAARDNAVPFYVALPVSTIDWDCSDGEHIPLETRAQEEVLAITGVDDEGRPRRVQLAPAGSRAHNLAFDITPAALVTALVTDYGVVAASPAGLAPLRSQMVSSRPM